MNDAEIMFELVANMLLAWSVQKSFKTILLLE